MIYVCRYFGRMDVRILHIIIICGSIRWNRVPTKTPNLKVQVEERWHIAYFYTNNNKPMRETHIKMHITLFTHMA